MRGFGPERGRMVNKGFSPSEGRGERAERSKKRAERKIEQGREHESR